ncbi:MAG: exonuclease domain-containing protein, partial [Acidimicrobiales bacterium]
SGLITDLTHAVLEQALATIADWPGLSVAVNVPVRNLYDRNLPDAVAARLAVALLGADPRVYQLPDSSWAMVPTGVSSPLLEECAFAVVDVETTGTGQRHHDRITEIAVVVVQGERTETVLDTLVNPERPIAPVVTAITNITNDMVKDAPTFAEVADDVLGVLAGRVFVAHNARFDWGLMAGELRRTRGFELTGPQVCTVRMSRRLVKDIESCALGSLCHHFGLENPARHRAGGDALVTAQLLHRLLPRAREQGVRTLRDLEQLLAATAGIKKRRRTSGRRS